MGDGGMLGGTALWCPKSGSPQTPFRERHKGKMYFYLNAAIVPRGKKQNRQQAPRGIRHAAKLQIREPQALAAAPLKLPDESGLAVAAQNVDQLVGDHVLDGNAGGL